MNCITDSVVQNNDLYISKHSSSTICWTWRFPVLFPVRVSSRLEGFAALSEACIEERGGDELCSSCVAHQFHCSSRRPKAMRSLKFLHLKLLATHAQ